jgi:hypothetical protein
MSDRSPRLDGPGAPEYGPENDVDVKALSPWPRLRGRPRRITYRQVFARSLAILGVAYGLVVLWLATEPYRRPMDAIDRGLFPIWLVILVVLAIIAAPLSALVLSAVWWFCWGSWNPHVSDLDARSGTSDLDEQPGPAPADDSDDGSIRTPMGPGRPSRQRRGMLRARPKRSGRKMSTG